jgi:hypothetical protein
VRTTLAVVALIALACSAGYSAEIYKCAAADGSVVYAQLPCEPQPPKSGAEQTEAIEPADCALTGRFAEWTARLMYAGISTDEVFGRYGGFEVLSKESVAVINLVYAARGNENISESEIAERASSKCEAGDFGGASCAQLPPSFIDNLGGCDAEPAGGEGGVFAEATETPASSRSAAEIIECKKDLRDEVDAIDALMRQGYTSEQGATYMRELRVLTQAMRDCER